MFDRLHKQFERKETDLYKLQLEEGFSRYILIRSLTNEALKELIHIATGEESENGRAEALYRELYASDMKNDDIIQFIRDAYPAVRAARKEQEVHLPKIVEEFGDVKCGIRNDNLNDTAKDLVRDKSIETVLDLEARVENLLMGTIRGYIMWQYYNQVTNDLIEHFVNDHDKVIPTLRKIKYVDFLVQIGEEIIPFDLKITHISDDYFDLYTQGLKESADGNDDFVVDDNLSEIKKIKEHYKKYKKELGLPNYGGLKKLEIVQILEGLEHKPTKSFLKDLLETRTEIVDELPNKLQSVEWWNYKYQGERLFKNNNRFFVFLAYKDSFEDARPLKGKLDAISKKVTERLNTITDGDLNEINYYYTKDKGLEGAYRVNSTSVLVTD